MKARQLIEETAYGPEALKVIKRAFDDAWADIAAEFGGDPLAVEAARLKLANTVLSIATPKSADDEALKRAALARMMRRPQET